MAIQGLHHITLVTNDAQRNVDFYVGVLGLRLVKKTVNFDDPGAYHLYYGDHAGTPGSAITFFEWPTAPKGKPGVGGTHHVALTVADESGLLKWKRRLQDRRVAVRGPYDRTYFRSIYFQDPDGVILEIATAGPGFTADEAANELGREKMAPPEELVRAHRDEESIAAQSWDKPVPEITPDMALSHGMHHISMIVSGIAQSDAYFTDLLGLWRVKKTANYDDPTSAHWYWGVDGGRPGTLVTAFELPSSPRVRMGAGQTHHFAFAVADEDEQLRYRERLIQAGFRVSPVMDRVYFKSIYSHDPDGHIVEIATAGPGFTRDEALEELGEHLMLPPWLEEHRGAIEERLTPITVPGREVTA